MRLRHCWRRVIQLLVVATSVFALVPFAGWGPTPVALANDATVYHLRDLPDIRSRMSPGDTWAVGGGYLYWARCSPLDQAGGYLRRWPLRGGRVVTMLNASFCHLNTAAADQSGLYYWNGSHVVRLVGAISTPFAEQIVAASPAPQGRLVIDNGDEFWGDYIFWLADNQIYSARKHDFRPAGAPEPAGVNASNLMVSGNTMYWFADGQLYSATKYCLGFGGGACARTVVAGETGGSLIAATQTGPQRDSSTFPLWTSGNAIRGLRCRLDGLAQVCGPEARYTGPAGMSLGTPATSGQFLFWIQNTLQCPPGQFCSWPGTGTLMKWNLHQRVLVPTPFDAPQPIACGFDCPGGYQINVPTGVAVADGWVYFDTSSGPSRIRVDAPPAPTDLAVSGWEVTQGIQNLANDGVLVPLVAGKPTYVRLYGRKLSGPSSYGVTAGLIGTQANGAPLPGSPLRPLNGSQNIQSNADPVRGSLNGSWLFQLPDSWAGAGTIRLRPLIDPQQVWNDPNVSNNTLAEQDFSFGRVAPVCLVFIPVRTRTPLQMFSASHNFAIDIARRILPTDEIWTYSQSSDIAELEVKWGGPLNTIPYPGYGPYEPKEDSGKMLTSLYARDQLSDDPDECDRAGARTHYVGVVAAEEQGNNGSSWRNHDNMWFRVPPADFSADWKTDRAVTLAHELGHNYGRQHINCGSPDPDQGFDAYPYDPCQLDVDDAHFRYYGFTYNTQAGRFDIIPPTTSGDLMSYAHKLSPPKPRWISDVTWRRLYSDIPDRESAVARQAASAGPSLAGASSVVLIDGLIDTTNPAQSILNHAWVYPTTSASPGLLRKWQRISAPSQAERMAATTGADARYHVRLRDAAGNLLDDRAVTLLEADDDAQPGGMPFTLSFPAPAQQVAQLELLDGETPIASIQPGASAPQLTLLSPAGGETIESEMTLAWRASDPDQASLLLFHVQYSPDNGQHWRAVLTSFPNRSGTDTVTLNLTDLSGLPASTTGGLIRVIASDGYNTTLATSQPFTVADRAPAPHIDSPGSTPLPAGQAILVRGGATDPEEGGLDDAVLRWSLDGRELGTGAQLQIDGLAPGSYTLALTARDAAGNQQTATSTLSVAPLAIPHAGAPVLDGTCDDTAYADAAQVTLPPYPDGSQAFARLARSDDALWACFVGMKRTGENSPVTLVRLRVDTNASREAEAQPDDSVFLLREDGVVDTYRGNGSDYLAPGPGGLSGQVSANDSTWMAEMRVEASAIGGWDHVIGLSVEQADVDALDDTYLWPSGSIANNPSTWAAAALGEVGRVSSLVPDTATAGAGDTTITIDGSGFGSGATVLWNGVARPTLVISSTQLQVTISAADLASAGTAGVAVANTGMQAAPSNSLPFSIRNPLPHISGLALNGTTLRITGHGFVNGTAVIWNGEERPTGFVGPTEVQATLEAGDLAGLNTAEVTVFNPEPGGGSSNALTLSGTAQPNRVYLPLVAKPE